MKVICVWLMALCCKTKHLLGMGLHQETLFQVPACPKTVCNCKPKTQVVPFSNQTESWILGCRGCPESPKGSRISRHTIWLSSTCPPSLVKIGFWWGPRYTSWKCPRVVLFGKRSSTSSGMYKTYPVWARGIKLMVHLLKMPHVP